jgi:hypothetical protein
LTVSVKAAPPALAKDGVIPLVSGTGFGTSTSWLTAFEVLPVKFVSPL